MDALSMNGVSSRRTALLALMVFAGACVRNSAVAQIAPSEYDLKAAFIYQFLSYVTWPERRVRADGTILIGVVGAPELAADLAVLADNQGENARAIAVRTLLPDGDPGELHIVFVAENGAVAAEGLLESALRAGVLTITEEFPRPVNSVINFEVIENKVRFDVALGLARANGLDISGRLLQVALRVMETP
jgi:hypothetical protein